MTSHRAGRPRLLRWLVGALPVAALVACGKELVPRDLGPLDLGYHGHCAIINGRYDVIEPIVRWAVVERVLPPDTSRQQIEAFSLLGNADRSLRLIAWSRGERRDTVQLRRGQHYRCSAERVVIDLPDRMPAGTIDPREGTDGRLTRTRTLALAVGAEGALTAEYTRTGVIGLRIPCGANCRYVPVPFSSVTTHSWTRVWPAYERGKPIPRRWAPPREQARNDRIEAAERALEQGERIPTPPMMQLRRTRTEDAARAMENGGPPL
ncbi:MAG: hypothetical protein K2R93_06165 [Gemmatimonadaceae bacterium]|nr:hypothetical protein [Gemmatimonadaceae bacterium]